MTKERLRTYRDLTKELKQIRQKIKAMEGTLYSPKVPKLSGMPGGGPSGINAKEELADKHLELLDHYREKEKELTAEQLAIEQAIDSLDYIERALLRAYYIDGLTWEQVCVAISYSWTQTHRIHGRALEKLKQEEPEA